MFAPWASAGVHDAITGDLAVFGVIHPGWTDRQAAADGNQWIFNDIGSRYAAFIELYETNPHPSEGELESFFSTNFSEGDGNIRTGFASYVAAMEETDPVRRQRLLFEGNTSVATHEQAGVQPYLEEISTGPDGFVTQFIDLSVGTAGPLDVDRDLPEIGTPPNNLIVPMDLLSLDTGDRTPASYSAGVPGATTFAVGTTSRPGVVDLAPMEGVPSWDPDFATSSRTWSERGGEVVVPLGRGGVSVIHPPADGLRGTGATAWTDRNERMWYITKLFEQHHTDPQLYRTAERGLTLGQVPWLDPATGLR
jgi:hypothetical protein